MGFSYLFRPFPSPNKAFISDERQNPWSERFTRCHKGQTLSRMKIVQIASFCTRILFRRERASISEAKVTMDIDSTNAEGAQNGTAS